MEHASILFFLVEHLLKSLYTLALGKRLREFAVRRSSTSANATIFAFGLLQIQPNHFRPFHLHRYRQYSTCHLAVQNPAQYMAGNDKNPDAARALFWMNFRLEDCFRIL
jgi:hypothetical protein